MKTNKFHRNNINIEKEKQKELNISLFFSVNSVFTKNLKTNELNILDIPKPNEHIYIITSRNRNADFIIKTISEKYNINRYMFFCSRLKENEFIKNLNNKTIYCPEKLHGYKLTCVRNHSKIYILDNFVILGSGNLSSNNAKIECYILFNNNELSKRILNFESQKNKIKIKLPEQNKIFFFFKNRDLSPIMFIEKINNKEKIKEIILIGYRVSKKAINYLSNFNIEYRISDSIKTMTPSIYVKLKNEKVEYKNYHQKTILIRTKNNYYIITSSNNIDTTDNLDYTIIENNINIYNKLKCREEIKT